MLKILLGAICLYLLTFSLGAQTPEGLITKIDDSVLTLKLEEKSLVDKVKRESWHRDIDYLGLQFKALRDSTDKIRALKADIKAQDKLLTAQYWRIAKENTSLQIGDYDEKTSTWPITVKSLDQNRPFEKTSSYSIAKNANKKKARADFESALQKSSLAARIEYMYRDRGRYDYAIIEYRLKLALEEKSLDKSPLLTLSQKNSRLNMVFVEGASFDMGDAKWIDASPVHKVRVADFYISKTEVTQKVYQEIMGKNPSVQVGDHYPVANFDWYDAVEFCNKMSEAEGLDPAYAINKKKKDPNDLYAYDSVRWFVTLIPGSKGYRLPTEAEWEFASRGGTLSKGTSRPGSDEVEQVAWYSNNFETWIAEVGLKKPNELGLFDMAGNVSEWCWDWYAPNYKGLGDLDVGGVVSSTAKIQRGGSVMDPEQAMVHASRNVTHRDNLYPYLGIRLVRSR